MEINEMNLEELETRSMEIAEEAKEADKETIERLNAEMDSIEERKAVLQKEIEERAKIVEEVISMEGEKVEVEERQMTNAEIRNSKEYIDAFADYIKTGEDREARKLLTENVSGSLPVPEFVDNIVRTAWENDDILSKVRKTYIRGNLKVAFEKSADGAYAHTEGTTAVSEESLSLGIVTMIPKNIKKWITISDEAVAMGGEAFLRYIYDELTYQIIKKLKELIVADIVALQTSGNNPTCTTVTAAPGVGTIASALATLSDEAKNPVVIMNRLTWGAFKAAQAANYYGYDPFEGLPVLFVSTLPAYSTASATDCYAIVGDLDGAQVNYPEGEGVVIKWDDLSLAEADMIKVVGRQYAAHAVTAKGRFCKVLKVSGT